MNRPAPASRPLRVPLSRRALLGAGLGAAAAYPLGAGRRPAAAVAAPSHALAFPSVPARPAAWRTWLLASAAELRPGAPAEPSAAEAEELLDLQASRTGAMAEAVARWGAGPAVLPWTALALELIASHKPSPVRAARALALLHVAAYDAAVAARDVQAAHRRPAPVEAVPGLEPLDGAAARRSGFGSEHAAVAGAAAAVLAELFPEEPAERFAQLADEATTSRLWAGVAYRGDIEAGLALGRAVGERAVARARSDGSDAAWDGARPEGPGIWRPTPPGFVDPPLDPLAGTWRPWVIGGGDAARPAPFPDFGSPAWYAELAAVQEAVARRTPAQEEAVHFWAGGPGTVTPGGIWVEVARDLILRDGLDTPHAARVLALTSVAIADAFVCCWDAKYAYWVARPITADPTLDVLIATPPFPSYTSGHATISAAAAATLGHLFPADAAELTARAIEAKASRLWAGIHYPLDNDIGAAMGGMVGLLLADVARHDGAE